MKKALVVGINYPGSTISLNGCIDDAVKIKKFLKDRGYDVKLLTEETKPTKKNIISGFKWLLKSNDMFLYFSGHGTSEGLLTSDMLILTKKDIHHFLMKEISGESRLRAVMDCCHGDVMNLKWSLKDNIVEKNLCGYNYYLDAMVITSFHTKSYDSMINSQKCGIITNFFLNSELDRDNIGLALERLNNIMFKKYNMKAKITLGKLYDINTERFIN